MAFKKNFFKMTKNVPKVQIFSVTALFIFLIYLKGHCGTSVFCSQAERGTERRHSRTCIKSQVLSKEMHIPATFINFTVNRLL